MYRAGLFVKNLPKAQPPLSSKKLITDQQKVMNSIKEDGYERIIRLVYKNLRAKLYNGNQSKSYRLIGMAPRTAEDMTVEVYDREGIDPPKKVPFIQHFSIKHGLEIHHPYWPCFRALGEDGELELLPIEHLLLSEEADGSSSSSEGINVWRSPVLQAFMDEMKPRGMMVKLLEPKVGKFESVHEGADTYLTSKPDGIRFRLVSYNILAQVYVKSSLPPHSPPACLKWKAPSHAILSVLRNLEADFFCLQEVDEYDSYYRKNMESLGYSGIYIQRTGQRKCDGCAIFYKTSCAELVAKERIEYNDIVNSIKADSVSCNRKQKIETSNEAKDSRKDSRDLNDPLVRLKRDCVGIMAAFRINKHIVIVANTHLYWDPELADVKLAQAKYLLSRLAKFKTLISDEFKCKPSLLLAGDFNSIPGDKVYSYIVSGNAKSAENIEEEKAPVPLCSVYEVTRGEPKFTNCTPAFTNTLDYIFFSPSDFIKPVSILQSPDPESPDVDGFLPNHVGAEFEIRRE